MKFSDITQNLISEMYKTESGQPFKITPGQLEIFKIIFARLYPRTHCITYTQYGKSDVVAQAVLTHAATFPGKWAIVAPSTKKAKIIMGYIIGHIFDNEYTASRFEIESGEDRDRIRRERSKDRINFRLADNKLGEIFILSTEGRRTKDVLDALMGFGASNVVLDESGLVDDMQYAGVKRMLGGHQDNFLFEIGNPFRRNHFYRTARDPLYHKIFIPYQHGIDEGRITREFIEEMRKLPMFDILYECKFPEADAVDNQGYAPLLLEQDLDRAYVGDIPMFGEIRMGVDVSGGGRNRSVIIIRGDNVAKVVYYAQNQDTMALTGEIMARQQAEKVNPANIFPDMVGIGKGLVDRLAEQLNTSTTTVTGINFGSKPEYDEDYINLRAQCYWRMTQWINSGGKLVRHEGWEELLNVKYKTQSDRKIKIISKDDLMKLGIESPDVADALALTFARNNKLNDKSKNFKQPIWTPTSPYEG